MENPTFEITHKDRETKARVSILYTKKGLIETPFFMPVSTKGAVKFVSSKDLEEMGVKAVISNSFILSLRPGVDVIKKAGSLGRFMNFSGINVTDSGGFQMYDKKFWTKTLEDGILFRNPFSGEKILMTPEKAMDIQRNLNAEIAMCLDCMPLIENNKEYIAEAVRKTSIWAKRCREHHRKLELNYPEDKRQLLFGITQGGIHQDLRAKSAKELLKMDFDGYSIGGLALGEPKQEEYKMIEIQKSIIPENKPIYLMGAGDPVELLEAISRGVDMFDSVFPTQNARRKTLFTSEGKLRIGNKQYLHDLNPIDENCSCKVCKNYSRAYIRHLLMLEEPVGKHLATYHNLSYINNLLEEAKCAIKKGVFKEFKEDIEKAYRE